MKVREAYINNTRGPLTTSSQNRKSDKSNNKSILGEKTHPPPYLKAHRFNSSGIQMTFMNTLKTCFMTA